MTQQMVWKMVSASILHQCHEASVSAAWWYVCGRWIDAQVWVSVYCREIPGGVQEGPGDTSDKIQFPSDRGPGDWLGHCPPHRPAEAWLTTPPPQKQFRNHKVHGCSLETERTRESPAIAVIPLHHRFTHHTHTYTCTQLYLHMQWAYIWGRDTRLELDDTTCKSSPPSCFLGIPFQLPELSCSPSAALPSD